MPLPKVATNVSVGGTRLYNNVTHSNRPDYFIKNWNFVLNSFGEAFGRINQDVCDLNRKPLSLPSRQASLAIMHSPLHHVLFRVILIYPRSVVQ